MKKLIFKTILFTLPFFIVFLIAKYFYVANQGDLLRIGYFTTDYGYNWNKIFGNEIKRKKIFKSISEINLKTNNQFDFFVVGDSFSEQRGFAYQNYLAEFSGSNILHLDKILHDNPIETIDQLLKGDFFDKIKCKYLILQCVERSITDRGYYLRNNNTLPLNINDLNEKIKKYNLSKNKDSKSSSKYEVNFFSKDIIRLPMYRLYYNFNDHAFKSPTYLVETENKLFSTTQNICLFYDDDLKFCKKLCEDIAIEQTNNVINDLTKRLALKKIKLITLIAPDKYELYYPFFKNKEDYPKPVFFDKFRRLKKDYIFVDSKNVLNNYILKLKDLYYLDDTHWSPFAAKIIGKEIYRLTK